MNAYRIIKLLNKRKEMKRVLVLASIVCVLALTIYYYLSQNNKLDPMACTANMVLSNENEHDLTANIILKISRSKDSILTQVSGTLYRNGIETNISRSIFFAVQDECCYSHLITKNINISSVDNTSDEYLKLLFPMYYLRKNESANIYIYPQENNDFIFSNGTHVYFLCMNTLS
ncbi:hypothetical protein [Serratia fonticola]|uniref:hypothetical protein n=1 Tax=Serratia fonticola TaxID=47917 RepID=UPI002DBFD46E|nr:hypothetical protein [Serratia fonticola]MEB7884611.1 hypothetical protein [Serratia fonticola]